MRINPTINISNNKKNIYFKQIKPEYMFIKEFGFDMNYNWAEHCVKIINEATELIRENKPFNKVLKYITKAYGDYYNNADGYGTIRGNGHCAVVFVEQTGKYGNYRKKLLKLVNSDTNNKLLKSNKKRYYFQYKTKSGKEISLSTISRIERPNTRKVDVFIYSTSGENIKPMLKEASKIYDQIIQNKNSKTKSDIKTATQNIAKIHWLISQAWPYQRGSAGVIDVFSKALFESSGIQISAYREGVNPNLRAHSMPIDKYAKKYANFFERMPVPFTN